MSQRPERTHDTPRWITLALLGMAVLWLHLMLLLGSPSGLAVSPIPSATTTTAATTTEPHRMEDAAPPAQLVQPPRATTSTVRWIVEAAPAPAPLPAPPPVARVAPPKSSTSVKPIAPSPAPQHAESAQWIVPPETLAEPPPAEAAEAADTAETTATPLSPEESLSPTAALATPEATTSEPPPAPVQPQHSEPSPPAWPPDSTQLAYDVIGNVKGLNYSARGTLAWNLADGQYSARMEVRLPLLGSRVQTSAGRVDGTGLLPKRFSDKSRSERAAHFDHTQKTIRFSNNRPDASLQPGAQDRLSLFMQLAGLLQAQPSAYPVGHVISLQVAGTSDAEIWRFRVAEEETLALPAGALRTRRLVREPREPRDSLIDIWFAPELGHLPVRIRITQDNGDSVDQQLSQMP
ncbi:MAG: DUF3108 domain-containing protein [Hydrogenophaga sp.]|uniref:DUF3108 domain-containing protein n=1 Tax=Hydrogenophaga sp. TaxID=1904254 RepID=UPI002763150E|nr:DUF3108 domain-containing protein [Hydrogenophaga sp.]MDP2417065.1 DUF3108 domain-containing protein [Hydrogenophaga sp.]MDZ4189465.1 DUF3108 domain-containing protein [Hydrogenophaga sp.]